MDDKITAEQLQEALGRDFDQLVQEVVRAVNEASPGTFPTLIGTVTK